MSEIIKVRINEDGVSATEVNRISDIIPIKHYGFLESNEVFNKRFNLWQEAESKLRTFEIESVQMEDGEIIIRDEGNPRNKDVFLEAYPVDSIHSAEILNNDKLTIRIL